MHEQPQVATHRSAKRSIVRVFRAPRSIPSLTSNRCDHEIVLSRSAKHSNPWDTMQFNSGPLFRESLRACKKCWPTWYNKSQGSWIESWPHCWLNCPTHWCNPKKKTNRANIIHHMPQIKFKRDKCTGLFERSSNGFTELAKINHKLFITRCLCSLLRSSWAASWWEN